MLQNRIAETSTAPGTSTTVNLAGALTNRKTFASQFTTGALVYYAMDDGTQAECGYGTFTAGAPNTVSRATVLWNSTVGNASPTRLNFTGTTTVYNDIPAERAIYAKSDLSVSMPGALTILGAFTGTGGGSFAASYATNGYQKLPGGYIHQWGEGTTGGGGTVVQNFPITFPTSCLQVRAWVKVTPASGIYTAHAASWNASGASIYGLLAGTLTSGLTIQFDAIGN